MYSQIRKNKRDTVIILFIYILFITLLCFFMSLLSTSFETTVHTLDFQDTKIPITGRTLATAIGFLLGIFFALKGYYWGDRSIMKFAGAMPVDREKEPYLVNLVEGISLAAGIPVPMTYLIETDIPNAFATGNEPKTASIAVTRGLLKILNREELEGVIAHEIAHIKNYDIRCASLAASLTVLVLFLSSLAREIIFLSVKDRKKKKENSGGGPLVLIGVVFILLSPIIASMLNALLSRRRESLADSTAVSLLGYPMGLARALHKISVRNVSKFVKNSSMDNQAISALCIVNPLMKIKTDSIFNTHPPTAKRISDLTGEPLKAVEERLNKADEFLERQYGEEMD